MFPLTKYTLEGPQPTTLTTPKILGGQVSLVSGVGQDSLGDQAVDFLKQRQVDTSTVAQSSSTQQAGPDNTVE